MTNISGETKNSATALMNIVGMLSYPVDQSLRKSFRELVEALEIARRLHTKQYVIGIHYFFWKRLNQTFAFIFVLSFGCD